MAEGQIITIILTKWVMASCQQISFMFNSNKLVSKLRWDHNCFSFFVVGHEMFLKGILPQFRLENSTWQLVRMSTVKKNIQNEKVSDGLMSDICLPFWKKHLPPYTLQIFIGFIQNNDIHIATVTLMVRPFCHWSQALCSLQHLS